MRRAIEQTRVEKPIEIDGWVLLPDHYHTARPLFVDDIDNVGE